MAKTKKGLSLVLAVVMLFSMLAVGAFAADAENAAFTVSTDAAGALSAGDTVTVTVSLTTDYFVGPLAVPVTYDATAFDLVAGSLNVSKIFGDATTDVVSSTKDGSVYVVISPKTSGTPTTAVVNNLTLFTFQLTAADVNGDFPIAITEDQKTADNPGGKWYCGSFDSADPKTANLKTVGQTFTKTDASVTIGSAAQPELQLSESGVANGVVIDKVSTCNDGAGFIYGINTDTGESIRDALATPAGDINVTPNDLGQMSTGAKIELLDNNGNVLETYIFIFFGDVNGDGFIDGIDVSAVDGVASYMDFTYGADDGSVEAMASDINGDGFIDGIDVSDIDGVASFMSFPTQAEYAATIAAAKGIA